MDTNVTIAMSADVSTMATTNVTSQADVILWNVNLYVTPVIIALGLLGNMTSFVVFMFTYMRHLSSSIYLSALAVTDSAFLIQL